MDIGTGPGSVIGLSGIEAPAMHLRELSGPELYFSFGAMPNSIVAYQTTKKYNTSLDFRLEIPREWCRKPTDPN